MARLVHTVQRGDLIAFRNIFGESLLAKAFDSGKRELFEAVLDCAWELREHLAYHQVPTSLAAEPTS